MYEFNELENELAPVRRADHAAGSSCGVPGRIVSKETFAIRLILTIFPPVRLLIRQAAIFHFCAEVVTLRELDQKADCWNV